MNKSTFSGLTPFARSIQILLWSCIEDYAGLWELRWEANRTLLDYHEDCRNSMVRDAVLKLVKEGFVTLWQCKEPYGEIIPLTTEDAVSAIHDEHNWIVQPFGAVSIRASATEKGELVYSAGNFNI